MESIVSIDRSGGRVMILASGVLEVPMIRVEGRWSVSTLSVDDLKNNFVPVEGEEANGVAVILTTEQVKKPSFEFCVTDVEDTLTYDDTANVENCDSN